MYNSGRDFKHKMSGGSLHISSSAYYKWHSGNLSPRQEEDEEIADKLEQMHMDEPEKGYRRRRDDLEVYRGIPVNDKRVLRICRKRGIKSTIKYANNGCIRQAKNPRPLDGKRFNSSLRRGGSYFSHFSQSCGPEA